MEDMSPKLDASLDRLARDRVTWFGPVLGIIGGLALAVGSFMSWAVIRPGSGFGVGVKGAVGGGRVVTLLGIMLVVTGAASIVSGRRLALLHVATGLVAGVAVVLTYAGPVAAAASDRGLATDPVGIGGGLRISLIGATFAVLGGLVTRMERHGDTTPTALQATDERLTTA